MPDRLAVYTDVVSRLLAETVACTPQEWTKGTLFIETDGVRINYRLKNEEEPGTASISERLRDLIDELYVRMRASGDGWREVSFSFWRDGDDLKFKSNFTYDERKPASAGKQWWKLWR